MTRSTDLLSVEQSFVLQNAVYSPNANLFTEVTKIAITAYDLNDLQDFIGVVPGLITSGIPGDTSDFISWCAGNPGYVGTNYNFGNPQDRIDWFKYAIFPAFLDWQSANPTIDVQKMLNGGYPNG